MIIFGNFLTATEATEAHALVVRECQEKCIASATRSIELVYDLFRDYDFFQTW
jgi:hypothetical protein